MIGGFMSRIYLSVLSFEITRKCNLECKWCAKGKAQDLDISKEIIDKSLDEISDVYINELRITGGEPFLNVDGLNYLIDKIIEKEIKIIGTVFIPTNAMIKDKRIALALSKLTAYCRHITQKLHKESKYFHDIFPTVPIYDVSNNICVICAASTFEHDNKNIIDSSIAFYNTNVNNDNFLMVSQDMAFTTQFPLILEGLAKDNYSLYSTDYLKSGVRVIDDKYCIITDDYAPDTIIINKTVSIASNGNVYTGGLSSYENEDSNRMFNIKNCNKNFFNLIEDWCWNNPINTTAHNTKERYLSYKWLKERNLCNENVDKAFQKINLELLINEYENALKEVHKEMKYLKHWEVDLFVICSLYLTLDDILQKQLFLTLLSTFNGEMIEDIINKDNIYKNKFKNILIELDKKNSEYALNE